MPQFLNKMWYFIFFLLFGLFGPNGEVYVPKNDTIPIQQKTEDIGDDDDDELPPTPPPPPGNGG